MTAIPLPHFTFNNGKTMPSVGLGCWMGGYEESKQAEPMVKTALGVGYRKIDTASGYGNEELVGKAISASGVPRSEIFLTTKLPLSSHDDVDAAVEDALDKFAFKGDDRYIDLMLMHWPMSVTKDMKQLAHPTFVETWKNMEAMFLAGNGKVRSIGISNFSIKNLEILLPECKVLPVLNQCELHPCLPQKELLEYHKQKGILMEAYCPLGQYNSPFFKDPTFLSIAEKNNITPAQVVLSWNVQRGVSVVPKSANEGRLLNNLTIVKLSDDDFTAVDTFHQQPGMHKSLDSMTAHTYSWMTEEGKGEVFGMTFAQLGWDHLDENGVVKA